MSSVYVVQRGRVLKLGDSADRYEDPTAGSVKLTNATEFYRALAFLYRSGHPISNAFRTLAAGTENEKERLAILRVFVSIRKGKSLADSFSLAGFSSTLVAAVRAGEYSGKIDEALLWYADFEQRNLELKRNLTQSFLYPGLTLMVALIMTTALPPFVLKDQLAMLAQSGTELPWLSQVFFQFSEFMTSPLLLLVLPVVWFACRAAKAWMSLRQGRHMTERFLYRLPIVGQALRLAAGSRSLALLTLLLKAGHPINKALQLAGAGSGSLILKGRLELASQALIGGYDFTTSLKKADWYSGTTMGLVSAGEASGDIANLTDLASKMEEEQLRERLGAFSTALQPLLLMFVGMMVCLTIMAVLGPSLSLIQSI